MHRDMDLSDFINETIKEIVKGVEKAQSELANTSVIVNPQEAGREKEEVKNSPHTIHYVDFEVVVFVEEQIKEGRKAGISIKVVSANIGKSNEDRESKTTKVRFSIPVVYPYMSNGNAPKGVKGAKMYVLKDNPNRSR